MCAWGGANRPRVSQFLAGDLIMEFFRMLVLCILFCGDCGFEPVSLEAFPLADCGCDGRAHIVFAPAYPELLHPSRLTGTALLSGVLFLKIAILYRSVKHFRFGNFLTSMDRRFVAI